MTRNPTLIDRLRRIISDKQNKKRSQRVSQGDSMIYVKNIGDTTTHDELGKKTVPLTRALAGVKSLNQQQTRLVPNYFQVRSIETDDFTRRLKRRLKYYNRHRYEEPRGEHYDPDDPLCQGNEELLINRPLDMNIDEAIARPNADLFFWLDLPNLLKPRKKTEWASTMAGILILFLIAHVMTGPLAELFMSSSQDAIWSVPEPTVLSQTIYGLGKVLNWLMMITLPYLIVVFFTLPFHLKPKWFTNIFHKNIYTTASIFLILPLKIILTPLILYKYSQVKRAYKEITGEALDNTIKASRLIRQCSLAYDAGHVMNRLDPSYLEEAPHRYMYDICRPQGTLRTWFSPLQGRMTKRYNYLYDFWIINESSRKLKWEAWRRQNLLAKYYQIEDPLPEPDIEPVSETFITPYIKQATQRTNCFEDNQLMITPGQLVSTPKEEDDTEANPN